MADLPFSDRLRILQGEMTQQEAAKELGITRNCYRKWLSGKGALLGVTQEGALARLAAKRIRDNSPPVSDTAA